jgi:hypothetical protein
MHPTERSDLLFFGWQWVRSTRQSSAPMLVPCRIYLQWMHACTLHVCVPVLVPCIYIQWMYAFTLHVCVCVCAPGSSNRIGVPCCWGWGMASERGLALASAVATVCCCGCCRVWPRAHYMRSSNQEEQRSVTGLSHVSEPLPSHRSIDSLSSHFLPSVCV